LHITNEEELSGLPEGTMKPLALWRKAKKKKASLDYPSYVPFVTYADNRELRKKILLWRKRFQNNELDNQQNVFKIAKLRFDRAQL
jgi:peptidyl-dipeptidase Dcp